MKEYKDLLEILKTYLNEKDLELVDKYYEYALTLYDGMKRITGEDYIYHAINIAYSLAELKMDAVTIGSALIHEAITLGKSNYEEITEKFDKETADILLGISKISGLKRTFKNNIERYRKIIVGLADNPKVIFIKLADRLDNLKTLKVHPLEHQKEIIEETENIFIPIAHRLGIKKIKSELEDYSLRISHPEEYNEILTKISASKEELEAALSNVKNEIVEILNDHKIEFTISSRVKSVRGIYNKLIKGRKWEDIYDLLGLRIIVNNPEECYLVIGLIHSKYRSIPKRFKDYIANPKSNMYQSLHTTIFGPNNHIYEVQVRTHEMDAIAESGVASHWSYKEHIDGSVKNELDNRLEKFKALIELNDMEDNINFFKNLNEELTNEEIYVFTPKGDVIELPNGSTPIDFAYKIHTEIGNTTTAALINNKMVKLSEILHDGDIVSLITQPGRTPNKAWLKFVKTDSAKARIKSYFFKKDKEKIVGTGRELVINEIKRRNIGFGETLSTENITKVLEEFDIANIDDLYFGVATLKYTPVLIVNKLCGIKEINKKEEIVNKLINKPINFKSNSDIIVSNSKDILTSIALCCSPVKGEEIIGYITKGNGVSIHRKNCKNINLNDDRIIEAQWDLSSESKYNTNLNIFIDSSDDKIVDVITVASKYEININSFNKKNNNKVKYYEVSCNVKNIEDLNSFIEEVNNMKNVYKVERVYIK